MEMILQTGSNPAGRPAAHGSGLAPKGCALKKVQMAGA
jgi:hypothetical protein